MHFPKVIRIFLYIDKISRFQPFKIRLHRVVSCFQNNDNKNNFKIMLQYKEIFKKMHKVSWYLHLVLLYTYLN